LHQEPNITDTPFRALILCALLGFSCTSAPQTDTSTDIHAPPSDTLTLEETLSPDDTEEGLDSDTLIEDTQTKVDTEGPEDSSQDTVPDSLEADASLSDAQPTDTQNEDTLEEDTESPPLAPLGIAPNVGIRGDTLVLRIEGVEEGMLNGVAIFDGKLDDIKALGDLNQSWWQEETQRLFVPIFLPADLEPDTYSLGLAFEDVSEVFPFAVDIAPGEITLQAGTGDLGKTLTPKEALLAEFFLPIGMDFGDDTLFFTDAGWNTIYALRVASTPKFIYNDTLLLEEGIVTPIAGNGAFGDSVDGDALNIPLSEPKGLCHLQTEDKELLFFADTTHHQIRVLNLGDTPTTEMGKNVEPGAIVTLAGLPEYGYGGDGGPALDATFFRPWRIKGCQTDVLYTGDVENYRIRAINRSDKAVTVAGVTLEPGHVDTLTGTGSLGFSGDGGPAPLAQISIAKGFALTPDGILIFADPENNRVRAVNLTEDPLSIGDLFLEGGTIDTLGHPGNFDGMEVTPGYNHPTGLHLDSFENLLVADTYSQTFKFHNLSKGPLFRGGIWIHPDISPTALAGIEHYKGGDLDTALGLDTLLADPFDIAFDEKRGDVYLADVENHVIRRFKLHRPRSVFQGELGPFPSLPPSTTESPHILNTDTGILTFADDTPLPLTHPGVWNFTTFHIPEDAALRLVGSHIAAITATESISIDGVLLIDCGDLVSGPGAGIGTGGGGHGMGGEEEEAGIPGGAYGTETLLPLSGGSQGGTGARGGGAVLLACQGPLTVAGSILANGQSEPTGGGGSGGGIRLVSLDTVTVSGSVSAQGGDGLSSGGTGRIRIEGMSMDLNQGSLDPLPSTQLLLINETPFLPGI
jgi:hypothetical protein